MFRCEGYENAHRLRERFSQFNLDPDARERLRERVRQSQLFQRNVHLMNQGFEVDFSQDEAEANRKAEFRVSQQALNRHCASAFSRFLLTRDLYLVGPEGPAVAVDHMIGNLHYVPLDTTNASVKLKPLGSGAYAPPSDAKVGWTFLSGEYLRVSCQDKLPFLTKAREELEAPAAAARPVHILNRLKYLADIEPFARFLVHYEGYVLAVPQSQVPDQKTVEKFLGIEPEDAAQPGRPSKRGKAAAAYRELFPDGHGKLPRKQVLRDIESHCGEVVSWNTLQKGLSEDPDVKGRQKLRQKIPPGF